VIGNSSRAARRWFNSLNERPPEMSPSSRGGFNSARGFTLLELMIVMFIIIILVTVAMPQYQHYVQAARESVLRDDLKKMRTLIDQYAADKGKLPQSLDDLVTSGYMREIPVDPMTEKPDWQLITGDDPNSTKGGTGLIDVKSASGDTSSDPDGKPYSDW
jgi:general secretion pathway protein G